MSHSLKINGGPLVVVVDSVFTIFFCCVFLVFLGGWTGLSSSRV